MKQKLKMPLRSGNSNGAEQYMSMCIIAQMEDFENGILRKRREADSRGPGV